jgi:cutinase
MKIISVFLTVAVAFASPLGKRQYAGVSTENQLTDGTPCRAITILFARGTTEAGNVGSLAGPPFFQAVANEVGADNVAVQGVRQIGT